MISHSNSDNPLPGRCLEIMKNCKKENAYGNDKGI